MTDQKPCLPGCQCECTHKNKNHRSGCFGATVSGDLCTCLNYRAANHAPNCPNAEPAPAMDGCLSECEKVRRPIGSDRPLVNHAPSCHNAEAPKAGECSPNCTPSSSSPYTGEFWPAWHAPECSKGKPAPAEAPKVKRCACGKPAVGTFAFLPVCQSCFDDAAKAEENCYHCEACALTCSPSQMVCCNCKRVLAGRVFKPAPAPVSVTPASDEEMADFGTGRDIAIYRREQDGYMHCVECDASPVGGARSGHRGLCSFQTWPKIKARIESEKAANAELRAANRRLTASAIMHPTGHCTCAGDGICAWCVMDNTRLALEQADVQVKMLRARLAEVSEAAQRVLDETIRPEGKAFAALEAILAKGNK